MQRPDTDQFVDVNDGQDLLDRFRRTLSVWGWELTRAGALLVACAAFGGVIAAAAFLGINRESKAGPLSLPPPAVRTSTTISEIAVYAAGAVERPGVYQLESGARVTDAIAAAGGLAVDADATTANLAALLNDGERVYIPRRGETPPPEMATGAQDASSSSGNTNAVVNLNTASVEQLDSLPGVGPSTAKAILDYRTEHGRFRSIEELIEVKGIGDAKMQELRKKVTV